MNVHRLMWLPAIALCINACSGQQTSFIDVQQQQTIVLKKRPDQGYVHTLVVKVQGEIEGQAKISLVHNKKVLNTKNITGRFKMEWGGDWYADEITFVYQPTHVKNGKVDINYEFSSL